MQRSPSTLARNGQRLGILALISLGSLLAYLDRSIISLAGASVASDFSLSPTELGLVFSAFSIGYVAAQIPAGLALDRLGTRRTYGLSSLLWSFFCAAQGAASGMYMLVASRFALGIAEAPCFPANSRVVVEHFAPHQRARATSVYTTIGYVGLAALTPALYAFIALFGWRWLCFALGFCGILFALAWRRYFITAPLAEDPHAELQEKPPASSSIKNPRFFLLCLGQFGSASVQSFALTWLPSYAIAYNGLGFDEATIPVTAGLSALFLGGIGGGLLCDRLYKSPRHSKHSRSGPMVGGLAAACLLLAWVPLVEDRSIGLMILCAALAAKGIGSLGWVVAGEIGPRSRAGLIGGIFNFVTNMAGVLTPILVGATVEHAGGFDLAILYLSAMAALSSASFFLMGTRTALAGAPSAAEQERRRDSRDERDPPSDLRS